MNHSYSPSHVANFFLDRSRDNKVPVSQLKLLKLVYIGYGWALALLDQKLFDEPILAWKHGPVVRSIYDEFKHFGKNPIPAFATDFDLETFELTEPRIASDDADVLLILNKVWDVYSPYDAWALRNKTHEPNTPWTASYKPGHMDTEISDSLIKEHFQKKISEYVSA